jgi:hypothetical protein
MHGPHFGDSVVQKVRCVEAEPIRELAGLRQEQEGEAELGDDGNGSTAARLCCCCYDYCGAKRDKWGMEGGGRSLGERPVRRGRGCGARRSASCRRRRRMAATRWRPPDAVRRGTGTRRVSAGAGLGWPAELGQKRGGNSRRKGKAFLFSFSNVQQLKTPF